jgi:hypothetical protein
MMKRWFFSSRKMIRILLLGMVFFATAPMQDAHAAGLVPCGTGNNPPCTLCHLVVGMKGIMDWGMNVMTFFAIAIIVAMAIVYIVSAGNSGMMTTAKNGIKATLIGFAVMLGSWVIVNFFMLTLANNGVGHATSWNTFTCDTTSKTNQFNQTNPVATTTGGTGTAGACEDIATERQRVSGGGTVCNNTGVCKSCDTSPYNALIQAAAAKYGVSDKFIKAIIARESSCNPASVKSESNGTQSCGLMQVNTAASGYTCAQLQNASTGIDEGTKMLAKAYSSAQTLSSQYGNTVTVYELAAAIHNAGSGQSGTSADCNASSGWPSIPKWGCPINPGSAAFNACDIRDYACSVGACVN